MLRLYVAGKTSASHIALNNLKLICELQMNGKYEIKVIDILEHPRLASENQILATPTLVRRSPRPMKYVIGDLSDSERVLMGLDLIQRGAIRRN